MTGDQLALHTRHMTLEEIGRDFTESYDEMIRGLVEEDEALQEAQLDDEAQTAGEFFPLVGPDGSIDDSEYEGTWL